MGGRYLLNKVERHLRIDVLFGVNRVRPACAQDLLSPLPAASRAADQLDPVQDGGRRQFLPKKKFEFREPG